MRLLAAHALRSLLVLLALAIAAALGQNYAVHWYTIDGGGVGLSNASTSGSYMLNGTIGQPDARNEPTPMVGGPYTMTGGFWVAPPCWAIPADLDNDCDVDQDDLAVFVSCASGPAVPHVGDCSKTDFNDDGCADVTDFAILQRCYSGENNPGDPNCAN